PFDVMDAGRMAVFMDPEGAAFCVWEAKTHKGARIVNENGSLNFNGLNTRNAGAAKEFYGAVFGWETLPLGSGEMWTLPGYGAYLETLNRGMRGGRAERGAPSGFEDVAPAIPPMAEAQPATPAHWSGTFAVDDADEPAKRAPELGGKVVVPPFDAPWV